MSDVLLLREPEVRAALDMPSLIEAMGSALDAYSSGRAELPTVIHLEVPEARGEIHVKAGHLHGEPRYAVKVSSGFFSPTEPPSIDGLVMVFDASTGALAALLLDGGHITDARTGAAGGLAASFLAPDRVGTVGVLGTGLQARYQLDALAVVRPFDRVRVWGRNIDHASACVDDLRGRSLPTDDVETAATAEEAVVGSDVVLTCTASTEPLVRAEWLRPGMHVTAVGSDGPGKRELDVDVLARTDLLVVDSLDQCLRFGELHHAVDAGVVDADDAIELGDVAGGRSPGRTSDEQLTVCDLTGVGVQDVAAAALVLERAPAGAERIRR
jgi:ornithine cyclodeaminase/alanine dehydrogenase-like protein (mu-crystallin family)